MSKVSSSGFSFNGWIANLYFIGLDYTLHTNENNREFVLLFSQNVRYKSHSVFHREIEEHIFYRIFIS
jgi:hypothetical protein